MQQNLKMMIVLGVNMFVLGSCECLLWSYVVEILCLDTNKKRLVDVNLSLDILLSFETPNTHLQQNLKMMIVLGVTMLVLGSCGWLLWSHVVEIICLDTDKTTCVNKDPILDILLFLEGPQIPTCSRI